MGAFFEDIRYFLVHIRWLSFWISLVMMPFSVLAASNVITWAIQMFANLFSLILNLTVALKCRHAKKQVGSNATLKAHPIFSTKVAAVYSLDYFLGFLFAALFIVYNVFIGIDAFSYYFTGYYGSSLSSYGLGALFMSYAYIGQLVLAHVHIVQAIAIQRMRKQVRNNDPSLPQYSVPQAPKTIEIHETN